VPLNGGEFIRFVLVEPSHSGNIGSAARALRVMGLQDLVVVNPRVTDFKTDPDAIAFASGADQVLTRARRCDSLVEALDGVQVAFALSAHSREFVGEQLNLSAAIARAHEQVHQACQIAFVFGTERTGLSIAQAQQCQTLVTIPTEADYGSLNLAQAVQVVAYALRVALLDSSSIKSADTSISWRGLADRSEVEGLMQHLETTLIEIGYLNPDQPKRLMPRLRRLFSRTQLEVEEIDILRGICRAITKGNKSQ
jgi:tRNA/rRNA methyltransferase